MSRKKRVTTLTLFLCACAWPSLSYPQQKTTAWVPFTAKKVERLYVPSSSGNKLARESAEWVARNSDGSLFTFTSDWSRGFLLDARTGDTYDIDQGNKTVTWHHRLPSTPLQPPSGEKYKHVPPERSLGTRIISGIECIGIEERKSPGDEQTTETWVAPALNFEVVETTVLDKKIRSEVVLENIQVGRQLDPRCFRIPEGFQMVYIGPL